MGRKVRDIGFGKRFCYKDDVSGYTFQLKKCKWWLLLLLLPLLFLIKCEEGLSDIAVLPEMVSLEFRTIDGNTGEVLPECHLSITSSITDVHKPISSGTGIFWIKNLRLDEEISIVASKPNYSINNTKISNVKVQDLLTATQDMRDIPLTVQLPPCDAGSQGKNNLKAGTVSKPQSYNMGVNEGTFDITFDTGSSCPDCIDIYNHKPEEDYRSGVLAYSSGQVATDGERMVSLSFSAGSVITIIVTTGPKDGSLWSYHVTCPY